MARKITTEACNAFMSARPFSKSNMSVMIDGEKVMMAYHGNVIARRAIGSNTIEVTNCGYSTNTTKERLNGLPGVSVVQRNFTWYLNGKEWDGSWSEV